MKTTSCQLDDELRDDLFWVLVVVRKVMNMYVCTRVYMPDQFRSKLQMNLGKPTRPVNVHKYLVRAINVVTPSDDHWEFKTSVVAFHEKFCRCLCRRVPMYVYDFVCMCLQRYGFCVCACAHAYGLVGSSTCSSSIGSSDSPPSPYTCVYVCGVMYAWTDSRAYIAARMSR